MGYRKRRQSESQDIVNKGSNRFCLMLRSGPRQFHGFRHFHERAAHDDHVPAFYGDVCTGADRHPHVGLGQSRRIVMPSPTMPTISPASCKLHDSSLILRKNLRAHLIDARNRRDGFRRDLVVSVTISTPHPGTSTSRPPPWNPS